MRDHSLRCRLSGIGGDGERQELAFLANAPWLAFPPKSGNEKNRVVVEPKMQVFFFFASDRRGRVAPKRMTPSSLVKSEAVLVSGATNGTGRLFGAHRP